MAIARTFLDWHKPILPAAADGLVERYAAAGRLDLSGVLLVVPGSRAGRLLVELLVDRASTASLALVPPAIETVGKLPEHLYEPKRAFASELVQRLAWAQALQGMSPERLKPLIVRPPTGARLLDWLDLGDVLWRQYRELAADELSFADVEAKITDSRWRGERRRWRLLGELQGAYLAILHDLNLWDQQTARLTAVEHCECRSSKDILLIATVDMNRTLRAMLGQTADRVTAFIHAPESSSDRFDAFGCLDPEAWQDLPIDLEDRQLRRASDPLAQADEVARAIADYQGRYRADEIAIGVPDETIAPQIQRRLDQMGLTTRRAVGKPFSETSPFRLLEGISRLVDTDRYADFAAILRHTDVTSWIRNRFGEVAPIGELDRYFNEHLPARLGTWLGPSGNRSEIQKVYGQLQELLEPLRGSARPITEWPDKIAALLAAVYDGITFSDEEPGQRDTLAACNAIGTALASFQFVPASMQVDCTASEAISMVLDQVSAKTAAPMPAPEAVELLGWLELPTDTAPALIVTSMNEGFVPTSVNSDLFLPNALRRHLGLLDNRRRYARDAYAMSVLLASRREVTFIVGRRDADNNPLVPSRLLFAADSETIVRRTNTFFDTDAALSSLVAAPERDLPKASRFEIPQPIPLSDPITSLRVTAFRDYLACPYRFYLRHILKLQPIDDAADEMGPAAFGNLIHAVAQQFAESSVRDSTLAGEIEDFLIARLDAIAGRSFGRQPLAAVVVQLEQCRARLRALAKWQAAWRSSGWRIEQAERPSEPFALEVDEERSLAVRGRIDRIDRHESTGVWAVLDYKTSNEAKAPDAHHRKQGRWVDLQLPLYRHMARHMGVDGPIRLGYIAIPKDLEKVGERMAEWTEAELEEADDVARAVARRVLDEEFWPPADPAPAFFDDVASICQDGIFGAPRHAATGEEGTP